MGTRYIWEKYNPKKVSEKNTTSSFSTTYSPYTYAIGSSAISEQDIDFDYRVKVSPSGATSRFSLSGGTYSIDAQKYPYITFSDSDHKNIYLYGLSTRSYYWVFTSENGSYQIKLEGAKYEDDPTATYIGYSYFSVGYTSSGSCIARVSSGNSNSYPTNGIHNGFLYRNRRSDNIDPTDISYPATFLPGNTITVSITAPNPVYTEANGYPQTGSVSYEYQYSANNGAWTALTVTSSKSTTYSVPTNVTSIRFRVRAKDTIGYTSADWITGDVSSAPNYGVTVSASPSTGGTVSGGGTYTFGSSVTIQATAANGWEFVHWLEGSTIRSTSASYTFTVNSARSFTAVFKQKLTAWIGVNDKARKGTNMWIGVNGKARKIVGAWVGVNGKARRFL